MKLWTLLLLTLIQFSLLPMTSQAMTLTPPTTPSPIQIEPTQKQIQNRLLAIPKPELLTFGDKIFAYSNKYGLGTKGVTMALEIMRCESGIKPDALNTKNYDGSWDYLWWQINDKRWEQKLKDVGFDIKDSESNLEAGFYLLSKYGIILWKASNKCHKLLG